MLGRPSYWPRSRRRWLVCLDLQRDYVIPGRPQYAAGHTEAARACARVLQLARRERWRVVHSQVSRDGCARNMFAAPIEELRPLVSEPVYFRRGLSAFANPGFADELSAAEGEEVFLVGFSLPDSCLATALAGHDHGVAFTLVEDAVGTGDAPADAAAAHTLLRRYVNLQSSARLETRELEVAP
jgi:nicotinamidase-related amidase